jgi:membrane protein YqaA with SNARE-associated domain
VQAWWFPWLLFSLNFLDYFCLVGFVVPVLQGVAFIQVRAIRCGMICSLCACGGFLGSWCLVLAIDNLQLLGAKVDPSKYEFAANLVKDWGPLAGLINGASPLPNIPLILAATALEANRWRVLLTLFLMSVGRFLKYSAMAITLRAGKAAAAAFTSGEAEEVELPAVATTVAANHEESGPRTRPISRAAISPETACAGK